jgi:hypothetical protein
MIHDEYNPSSAKNVKFQFYLHVGPTLIPRHGSGIWGLMKTLQTCDQFWTAL